jgi:hypothetical protein
MIESRLPFSGMDWKGRSQTFGLPVLAFFNTHGKTYFDSLKPALAVFKIQMSMGRALSSQLLL